MAESPFSQFTEWFTDAKSVVPTPNAMTLATVNAEGAPRARILLLKTFDESGFVFFTNYRSKKSQELEKNPKASLCFHWDALQRQIRIEGVVQKTSRSESENYFATRPRESQIGAWASHQSEILASAEELQERVITLEKKYQGHEIPCPEHWGGFRLRPELFEFWQGRTGRLHDRLRYTRAPDQVSRQWRRELLNP